LGESFLGFILRLFPRFVTEEDIKFIDEFLRSDNVEANAIGFEAFCILLTKYEISQLSDYLKDDDFQGEYSNAPPPNKKSRTCSRIAEKSFARLASEDELPNILRMLGWRSSRSEKRAAFRALARKDLFLQIPPEVKQLLRQDALRDDVRQEPNPLLVADLITMLTQDDEIQF
jgi:hypothetical protein